MRTSRTRQGHRGHHLGSLLAVSVGLTIVVAGYAPMVRPAEPTARVEVSVTVPHGTPASLLPAATATGHPDNAVVGVRVPTHEEIHAQCRAADLVDECRAAGLR